MEVGKLYEIPKDVLHIFDGKQQCSKEDIQSLASIVTMVEVEHPVLVEIGSWEGLTTTVLANQVKGRGMVYAVDHWLGNPSTLTAQKAALYDVFSVFKLNLKRLDLWNTVRPMIMKSEDAVSIFADEVADLIFIDADHRYSFIKPDIEKWLPKLKKGGILCGHDAEYYYSKCNNTEKIKIDSSLELDYIRLGETSSSGIHSGVVKALYECLDDKHTLMPTRMWWIRKEV